MSANGRYRCQTRRGSLRGQQELRWVNLRALRRRLHCRVPARERGPVLPRRDARAGGEVRADTPSREDPVIEFGRVAAERRNQRGLGKPETVNLLAFTVI